MNYNLNNSVVGSQRPPELEYQIAPTNTDGVSSQEETPYDFSDWMVNYGAFLDDPHFANAIMNNADWIWGRGWESDDETEIRTEVWNGYGKETALDIMRNLEIVAGIQGDAIAQIIWNDAEKRDYPINVKPLNMGSMRIWFNRQGIIIRYSQMDRTGSPHKVIKDFNPEDIYHIQVDRVADQFHGLSKAKRLTKYIKAQGESFADNQTVMHREAKPVILIKLKTDDQSKIANIKDKVQTAMRMSTDNIMFIPDDEDVFSYEVLKINTPSPILMEWKDSVRKDMYSTIGSPELLSDSSGATESGGKIGNLNFAQIVESRQLRREQSWKKQLHLKINLVPPKSIEETLMMDAMKDGAGQQGNFQPQDAQGGRDASQEEAPA